MRRLACLVLLAIPACGGDDIVCPDTGSFTLSAPDGFAELVPGGHATISWTSDGDETAAVELELIATDSDARIALPYAQLREHVLVWNGLRGDGSAATPANYRVGGTVGRITGCAGVAITPDDLHLVVVQGLRMPADPITFTGAQLTRMFTVTTVTRSPLDIRYAVDPDTTVDGDELVFVQTSVPGEFAPVARPYPFSGMTTASTAIPAGTYTLTALVGTPTAYRVDGPQLTWTP